jgi:hypothetical protein
MLQYLPLLEVRRKLQVRVSRDLAIFEKTWCRISSDVKPLQSFAISRVDPNLLDFPHRHRLAGSRFLIRLSATEH